MKRLIALVLSLFSLHPGADTGMTPEELEKWLIEDDNFTADQVNEGELEFLPGPPRTPVLHSLNTLTVNQESIENGWVLLVQCYRHLDPVPDAEVVYQYKSIRNLKVTSRRNINNVLVKGQSVKLENIQRNAELCIQAGVRIFYKNRNGTFSLRNGPFHRRFLDGYFPYHVTLKVHYPSEMLTLIKTEPVAQAGFNITQSEDLIIVDSHFEGILNTEMIFRDNQNPP